MRWGPEGFPLQKEGGRHPSKLQVSVLTQMLAGGAATALHQKHDLPWSQTPQRARRPPSPLLDEAGLQPCSFIAAWSVMLRNTAKCKRNLNSNLDAPWDTNLSAETLLKAMWVWKVTAAVFFFCMSESKTPKFANQPTPLPSKMSVSLIKIYSLQIKKKSFLLLPVDLSQWSSQKFCWKKG